MMGAEFLQSGAGACLICGAPNPPMARYCHRCGAPQAAVGLRSATQATPLLQQWRLLKANLTRREVRRILGEPLRLVPPDGTAGGADECWTYVYVPTQSGQEAEAVQGELHFAADGRLMRWCEPDWPRLRPADGR